MTAGGGPPSVWARIVDIAERRGSPAVAPEDVCRACAEDLAVDGVALVAVSPRGRQLVAATDPGSRAVEEWQQVNGRGPAVDAIEGGTVVVDDVAEAPDAVFAEVAAQAGVGALAALPVRLGGVVVGALTLVRAAPGAFAAKTLATAAAFADAAGAVLLDGVDQGGVDQGGVDQGGTDRRAGADAAAAPVPGVRDADQAVVLQAAGMVAVQLGVDVDEGRRRLGAYAAEHGTTVGEVARAVVTRRLRMGPGSAR
ncbi:GAF domain-containing protein [Pseudonocardia sp. RS010]|uniref:GAF domain-containing protein n=1 Tax=Pseudonocardia sp. RS010 TaxID=3385979 RepID=UPI00399FC445